MSQTDHETRAPAMTPIGVPDAEPIGTVRITKHVLATIIELAALSVEGVARIAPISSSWARLWTRAKPQRGIALNVRGSVVSVDLYLILKPGVQMATVGRDAQNAVAAAIEDMLGMTAQEINVFIQDVA